MWWSRVKSCAVKETCREQAITSEQIWTTSSYNNDWQFRLPYAQLWQFLWENVWQIYWVLLALFWAFCDSCLLLGHRVTTLRSENTKLWKFWTSTAFDRLSFAIEGTAPGAIGARHEVSRGASRRSWSFPLRVDLLQRDANVARFRQALVQSFQACHGLSAGISSGLCRQNFQNNIFEPT